MFIKDIKEDTFNYRLVSNVVKFAKNNNLRVCVEGVEDIEELSVLEDYHKIISEIEKS